MYLRALPPAPHLCCCVLQPPCPRLGDVFFNATICCLPPYVGVCLSERERAKYIFIYMYVCCHAGRGRLLLLLPGRPAAVWPRPAPHPRRPGPLAWSVACCAQTALSAHPARSVPGRIRLHHGALPHSFSFLCPMPSCAGLWCRGVLCLCVLCLPAPPLCVCHAFLCEVCVSMSRWFERGYVSLSLPAAGFLIGAAEIGVAAAAAACAEVMVVNACLLCICEATHTHSRSALTRRAGCQCEAARFRCCRCREMSFPMLLMHCVCLGLR